MIVLSFLVYSSEESSEEEEENVLVDKFGNTIISAKDKTQDSACADNVTDLADDGDKT